MRSKLINQEEGRRTYAVSFDSAEEPIDLLKRFAKTRHLMASAFTGTGILGDVTLGFLDLKNKSMKEIVIDHSVNVLALSGSIEIERGGPSVHAQVVVGSADGSVQGGQLIRGHAESALELIIYESPRYLQKKIDPTTGLPLIHLKERAFLS